MGAAASYPIERFPQTKPPWGVFDSSSDTTITTKDGTQEQLGPILYNVKCKNKDGSFSVKTQGPNGESSVYDIFLNACEKLGPSGKKAAGFRRLKKVHMVEENGRKFEKLEMENKYHWVSFPEYQKRVGRVFWGGVGRWKTSIIG